MKTEFSNPEVPFHLMKSSFNIILCLLFFSLSCMVVSAQDSNWRTYVEQLAEEEMSETTIENLFEELTYLENNPMNLNTVTREQLERFPLVSPDEATAIADFLDKNRPVYTVFELRNVPQLSYNTVELILPFFYVGEQETKRETVSQILKNGRSELQLRSDKTLNQRAGYGEFPDSILQRYPNRKYSGEDFYHSLRYSFRYRDKMQFGITAEKDPGEPFLKTGYQKGYDHYGLHFIMRDIGNLKTLALGDYRLSFGQGLVLNNDFMVSKAWTTDNIIKQTTSPKRHFSTAESGFFRGVAAVYKIRDIAFTAFYSNRLIDANLSVNDEITSFKIDGYHRTPLEIEKKKNVHEQVTGANVNYRKNRFQIGVSGIYYSYDKMYNPTLREDNLYHLRDNENSNAGIDYSYRFRNLMLAGETAIAKNGAVATLNMVQYKPSSTLSLTALHRYYPISYNALYAQAFSEGSRVQNENGFYLGAKFSPFRKVSVNTYIDFVRFPWLRFGVSEPSGAIDFYFLGIYSFSRESNLEVRYKFKQREKNMRYPDENSLTVLPYNTQKLRFRYNQTLKSGWNFRTTADMAFYNEKYFPKEFGYMVSQNIGYRGNAKWSGDAYVAYFNADTYDVRLYSYERNLLNTFYMPSFYGDGYRLAASARYNITNRLSFSLKCGHTRYFNRETIGSGNDLIKGNSRTDIFTYLRWQF